MGGCAQALQPGKRYASTDTDVCRVVPPGTDDGFVAAVDDVALVPGGLALSRHERSWRHSVAGGAPADSVLGPDGSMVRVPKPLCFPGDESAMPRRPSGSSMPDRLDDLPGMGTGGATARAGQAAPGQASAADVSESRPTPAASRAAAAGADADFASLPPPPRPTLAVHAPNVSQGASAMELPPPRPSLAEFHTMVT